MTEALWEYAHDVFETFMYPASAPSIFSSFLFLFFSQFLSSFSASSILESWCTCHPSPVQSELASAAGPGPSHRREPFFHHPLGIFTLFVPSRASSDVPTRSIRLLGVHASGAKSTVLCAVCMSSSSSKEVVPPTIVSRTHERSQARTSSFPFFFSLESLSRVRNKMRD